ECPAGWSPGIGASSASKSSTGDEGMSTPGQSPPVIRTRLRRNRPRSPPRDRDDPHPPAAKAPQTSSSLRGAPDQIKDFFEERTKKISSLSFGPPPSLCAPRLVRSPALESSHPGPRTASAASGRTERVYEKAIFGSDHAPFSPLLRGALSL